LRENWAQKWVDEDDGRVVMGPAAVVERPSRLVARAICVECQMTATVKQLGELVTHCSYAAYDLPLVRKIRSEILQITAHCSR